MSVGEKNPEQWYMSKMFEMIVDFQKEVKQEFKIVNEKIDQKIEPLQIDVTSIKTMLRDYNGLWEKVDAVEDKIDKVENRVITLETSDSTKEKTNNKFTVNTINIISIIIAIGMFTIALVK